MCLNSKNKNFEYKVPEREISIFPKKKISFERGKNIENIKFSLETPDINNNNLSLLENQVQLIIGIKQLIF